MIFNNIYASLSSPNLARSAASPAATRQHKGNTAQPATGASSKHVYEYEDILRKKNSINYSISDILARESDVIISNKITSKTEYNGFAIHLLSICFLVIWLLWSLVPQRWFHSIGVYYYPDRWWQLAISSYVLVAMVYIYVGLALYNIEVKARPLDDISNIVDEHAIVSTSFTYDEKRRAARGQNENAIDLDDKRFLWTSTSGVWDLPITTVSKILYSDYDDNDL